MRDIDLSPFFVGAIIVIGLLLVSSELHCDVRLKVENGTPDAGYTQRAGPCQNYCPLPVETIEMFQRENERLEHERVLVRTLLRRHVRGKLQDQMVESVATSSHFEKLDPLVALSIIRVESNYRPWVTSQKGAMGLMQLMPETARRMGARQPYSVEDNVRGGVRYLKLLEGRFGDIRRVAAAYNAGPGSVDRFRGVPPFPETIDYVRKVTAERRRLERERRIFEEVRAER